MKSKVIARLTAIRADGMRTIVELSEGATFMQFYHWQTQQGRRYSTKKHTRWSSRNDGLPMVNAHLHQPGLEALQTKLEGLTLVKYTIKIRIFRKRAYRKLINAAPDALGPLPVVTPYAPVPPSQRPIRVILPEPSRRYSILEGWRK